MKESSRMPLFDLRKLNASLPVPKVPNGSLDILVLGANDDFIVVSSISHMCLSASAYLLGPSLSGHLNCPSTGKFKIYEKINDFYLVYDNYNICWNFEG